MGVSGCVSRTERSNCITCHSELEHASGTHTNCIACHGGNLQGQIDVPGIAGHSPVYIARQLYSFKNDVRKGPMADVMKAVAANLTDDDIISIASYVASRDAS